MQYEAVFHLSLDRMASIRDVMITQMELGLQGKPGGLMMLPSFVDVLPTGEEEGEFYAIDLGGTNLRVMRVKLGQQRGSVVRQGALPACLVVLKACV